MRRGLVVAMCAVCIAACGGDDGSEDPPSFRVLRVTPTSGATEVDIATAVVVELSEPVDPDTADGDSIALGVEADLMVEGSTITVVPAAPLPYETEVELVISTRLTSVAGTPLPVTFSSRFSTRWRLWSRPQVVGPASGLASWSFRPRVAARDTVSAVAVWQSSESGEYPYHLAGARYQGGADTWTRDPEIAVSGLSYSPEPQLLADAAGRVLLIWRNETRIEQAWLERDADGWDQLDPVYAGESAVSAPALAMSPAGRAALAWTSSTGGRMVAHYDGTWSAPDALDPGDLEEAALAVDDAGDVTLVWTDGPAIMARHRRGTWSDPATLWTDEVGSLADRPRVAALPGGGAIAVWGVAREGEGGEVHARFLDGELGTWSGDEVVGTADTPAATLPEVAVTAAGDVILVWADWNGGLDARWWRDGVWDRAATLAGTFVHAPEHAVAVDADGNAATAFADIDASYYRADRDAWVAQDLVSSAETAPIGIIFVGDDPLAVWEQVGYDEDKGMGVSEGIQASLFR